MFNKRQPKIRKMESKPLQMWKQRPPGPEQRELERMFNAKEIDATTTPDVVRKSNEMFQNFSHVFATHFRATKAKLGLCAAVGTERDTGSSISELGGPLNFRERLADSPENIIDSPSIEFRNAPFWTWVYFDHEKNMDFVCVAVLVLCGSRHINFAVSEDGAKLTIKYIWPTAMYIAAELFQKAKNGEEKLSIQHPKVHAFVARAQESGVTGKSNPEGEIIIDLPQKVQRNPSTWKKEAIKMNETNVILLEFSALEKSLVIDDADTSINFN